MSSKYKRKYSNSSEDEANLKIIDDRNKKIVKEDIEHKTDYNVFNKYKYELNKLLNYKEQFIKNFDDFWTFLNKYEMAEKRMASMSSTNKGRNTELVNFRLSEKLDKLYEKLPLYDRHGNKVRIEYDVFKKFIDIVLLYLDFKQKEKFMKLKKLRTTQAELPITKFREEIIDSIKSHRVVLIAGDTGCGKSTQVPQYIYKAGFQKIACTQPRRIACISLSKRVAYETLTEYKSLVGYQIRFEKTKRKDTQLIFITEGLLLRQASDEDTLLSYDIVILDEVHERHLGGDFLTGIMKCLLYKRDDFKLILMSATINIKLFHDYFAEENIKLVQVPGRLYPIEIIYKPIIKDRFEKKTAKFDSMPYLQILQIIDQKYPSYERGDLLVFLSGIADITKLSEDIIEYSKETQNWIVLQLHSSLSLAEQDKVFDYAPEGVRKCIISTNIAETSVTIDGVRFVIDSGKVNKMMYHTIGGINKLTEQPISQDSAKQRSGRAGRTGPGVCYRLYSEEEYNKFEHFTIAEIHLVPLEALVINMLSLGLQDITNFPFLEKPNLNAVNEAIKRLHFFGAVVSTNDVVLTPLGEALSKLPVDLTIGKMLILSTVFGNVTGVLCLAAVINVQSPLTNKAYRDLECQNARKLLESNHGDPITLLNLFKEWLLIKQNTQPIASQKGEQVENSRHWCRKRGLEEQRFYEVMKLMTQFKDILEDSNLLPKDICKEQSSAERSMRHGELKKLKSMRYELKTSMKSSNRKHLKYRNTANVGEEEEELSTTDIRDVEFRISHDNETLQKLLNETSIESSRDLTLLKLTLCSGFYPQIAVADEYNYCKSPLEQLFHTKQKCFVSLHPMSYFGNNTEPLKLSESDIEVPPEGFFSKNPLSSRHQILLYQSLLETTKVYLMNTMRMPAVQTLLLFSKNIQSNETLTRIACDEFLIMDLPHFGQGKTLLLKAIFLRNKWLELLNNKFQVQNESSTNNSISSEELIYELVNFMHTNASYTVKRLLKADLKTLYTFSPRNEFLEEENNPFDKDYIMKQDEMYGGVKVSENVTYACIIEEEWSLNLAERVCQTPLNCTFCENTIYGSFFTQLQHESMCKLSNSKKIDTASFKPDLRNAKKYDCEVCKQTLYLSVTEILKHKKKCSVQK